MTTEIPQMNRTEFVETLLKTRYYTEGETEWYELVGRVVEHGTSDRHHIHGQSFFNTILDKDFIPSRMPYMGSENPFSSSCFVFEMDDDWESIYEALHDAVAVQRFGGGTGFNFSTLRPEGDLINTTKGFASGPVSFMEWFQATYQTLKRAGNKMAANMALLDISHPDIEQFIKCKQSEGNLWCFNISVRVTDEFMRAVQDDLEWHLVWDGEVRKTVQARYLWNLLAESAHMFGEPGIQFSDAVDRGNKFPVPVVTSNPCGEQLLPDRTSCNLGAINLAQHVTDDGLLMLDKLESTVRTAVRFLDGSLASAWFPVQEIRENADKYRNLGLSPMGWHDMLIMADIPYDSPKAIDLARKIQLFITATAESESRRIGFEETGEHQKVNVTLTTVQPTGSLSVLASCTSAIEPMYSPIENRLSYVGTYSEIMSVIKRKAEYEGWNIDAIIEYATIYSTLQGCPAIPENKQALFLCANEIPWEAHVDMQAAFQEYIDQAVSKTINLDNSATVEDIANIYMYAWQKNCKSITVYRQNSREVEILTTEKKDDSAFCPACLEHAGERRILIRDGGCTKCLQCDYSICTI